MLDNMKNVMMGSQISFEKQDEVGSWIRFQLSKNPLYVITRIQQKRIQM